MYRTLEKKLLAWRQQSPKKGRKPLLLHGARQVGKTHLLQELGRQAFEHVVYLNFETDPAMAALFQDDITPQHLVHDIELMTQTPVVPGKTLLIFDEIQASERAACLASRFIVSILRFPLARYSRCIFIHWILRNFCLRAAKQSW